jgi:para-nitrobenzyl esterase
LPQPLTDAERALSTLMVGYWGRHAASGDPNGKGATEWPEYDMAKDQSATFAADVTISAGLKKDLCDFWDGIDVKAP